MMERPLHPKKFFSDAEKRTLVEAIRRAESKTSGEIRVHLAKSSGPDHFQEALKAFAGLRMTETRERNGILFFLSLKERALVILGDRGIHEKVEERFWNVLKDKTLTAFSQDRFVEGLMEGIEIVGSKLAKHFPRSIDDKNELSDEITQS